MTAEQVGILAVVLFAGGVLLRIVVRFRRGDYSHPDGHGFWGGGGDGFWGGGGGGGGGCGGCGGCGGG